jgi:uncharacterized repeat protein (TIGR03803 family)
LEVFNNFHDFNTTDGENPLGEPIWDALNAEFVGVTESGGLNGIGSIFTFGQDALGFAKVYDFTIAGGSRPLSGLFADTFNSGVFFGTTNLSGAFGEGTIYTFNNTTDTYSKIFDFNGFTGGKPQGRLARSTSGKLYGNTFSGGAAGYGVLFSIDPNGSNYAVLNDFDFFTLGANPVAGWFFASDANFYALVSGGGEVGDGYFCKADSSGQNLTGLFSLNGSGLNGGFPQGSLFEASNGKLFGGTTKGGVSNKGIVYSIDPSTDSFSKISDLSSTLGSDPRGVLAESGGKLYGLAYEGGNFSFGSIFEIDLAATPPVTPVLKVSLSSQLGTYPQSGLLKGNNGNLFGTTSSGGTNSAGVLFEYNPANNAYLKRHEFIASTGSFPSGNIVQAPNGKYYGFTTAGGTNLQGVIFEYNPMDSSYAVIHNFNGTLGSEPWGSPVFSSNGLMYGFTKTGGLSNKGVIFSFDVALNSFNIIHELAVSDGGNPEGSMIFSDLGQLYGASFNDGSASGGSVFEVTTGGTFTKKFDLSGVNGFNGIGGFALEGCQKVSILTQPVAINSCPGNTVQFNVSPNLPSALAQWYKDGVLIVGATDTVLTLNAVQAVDSGSYHCVIYNSCGYVVSNFVKLKVVSKPASFIVPGGPPIVCASNPITTLNTNSAGGLTYQWRLDGVDIPGANASNYIPFQTGNYSVVVSSGLGCDSTSADFFLTALADVTGIAVNITSNTVEICGPTLINFSSSSVSAGSNPLYQWAKNGTAIFPNGTASTLSANAIGGDVFSLWMFPDTCSANDTIFSNLITVIDTCNFITLTTLATGSNSFCAGDTLTIAYQGSAAFNGGNVMDVQLSDQGGNFSSPITIGSAILNAAAGSIVCSLPSGISGNNYRIRVVASSPATIGSDNGNDLIIGLSDFGLDYSVSPNQISNLPLTATFTNLTPNSANYNFTWYFGDGIFQPNASSTVQHIYPHNGVFYPTLLALDANSGCRDTLFNTSNPNYFVQINAAGAQNCTQTASISPSGIVNACQGGVVNLTSTAPVNATIQWTRYGVILAGENSNTLAVNFVGGFYSFTAIDSITGCVITAPPTRVNFNLPAVIPPLITVTGNVGNCGVVNATLTASGSFAGYLWNTGATGNAINISQGGVYQVIGQGSIGCDAVSLPENILGSNVLPPVICMVSATDDNLDNEVVWISPITTDIDSFYVFREDLINQNVFTKIGAVDYDDPNFFIDTAANPTLRANRYKMAIKDNCGGVTFASSTVRSMFLTVNPYIGIKRFLTWNVYEGQSQFIDRYLILSGPDQNNLVVIDSVSAPANFYIDNLPSAGLNTNYRVEARLSQVCDVSRAARTRSRSNGTGNTLQFIDGIQGFINDFNFKIKPNPNNGEFTIELPAMAPTYNGWIEDLTGRKVNEIIKLQGGMNSVKIQMPAGMYLMRISHGENISTQRISIVN